MQLAIIGLGRMGGNIARRLMKAGHTCVVYDANPAPGEALAQEGAQAVGSLEELVQKLEHPAAVWSMLPAGKITEDTVTQLGELLSPGDCIIDGGNAFYKDDIRRGKLMAEKGIDYVDCGTSGGIWGLDRGYCMMIGGPEATVERLDPIFAALAPGMGDIPRTKGRSETGDNRAERGYIYTGSTGSGRFVKMVHNGIEYGLMEAYAEGFDIMRHKASTTLPEDERFTLNLPDIAEVWRRGSVISSWLLDLSAVALIADPHLASYSGYVEDTGEGRWTLEAAIEESVPVDVLASALFTRFRSRQEHTFAERMLSAMRFGFGGHKEPDVAKASEN